MMRMLQRLVEFITGRKCSKCYFCSPCGRKCNKPWEEYEQCVSGIIPWGWERRCSTKLKQEDRLNRGAKK